MLGAGAGRGRAEALQHWAATGRVRQEGTQSVAVALVNQSRGGHRNAASPPCRAALGERGEARAAPGCPQPRPGLSSGAAVGRQVATLHFISWDCKKKQAKPPRLAKGQRWQLLPAALLCEAGCSAGSAQGRVWVRRRWGPADPAQLPQHLPSSCVPMAPCLCATLTLVVPVFS